MLRLLFLTVLLCLTRAQLSEEQELELTHDEVFMIEFFKGSRIEELNPRVYSCIWTQNRMMKAYNITEEVWNMDNATHFDEIFPTWQVKVYNITEFISEEASLTWYNCLNAMHDTVVWWDDYSVAFNDTEKYYSYPVSVLQTALEHIVYFSRLNMAMYDATEAEDFKTFYFMLGRFMRLLLIVDPLPIETIDDMEDKAFGKDDDEDFDGGYTPYDSGTDDGGIAGDDDYDPYADVYDDTVDPWWDDDSSDDEWNSLFSKVSLPKVSETRNNLLLSHKMLGAPPDYIPAEELNWVYIMLFFIEGFGSQTIGFSSSYFATQCGSIGWAMFESFEQTTLPAIDKKRTEPFINSSTFQLRQIDPLVKHCFETGNDYEKALTNYGTATSDPVVLGFNILYHMDKLYENTLAIIERFDKGYKDQDSAYYQRLGRNFGLIVFWSLYDVGDYSFPDISISYPEDFDEEVELDWDFDSMI